VAERKLWLFDYDDTLAPNLHDYSESIMRFVKYCIDTFGYKSPDIPRIVNIEDKIDSENVEKIDTHTGRPFKFTARRFPTSLVQAFEYIAEGVVIEGKPFVVNDRHRQEVWDIGNYAFDEERYHKQGLFPGAANLLDFLKATGDELKLVPKGEPWVQERKFRATNMRTWFGDNIEVVPYKDKDIVLKLSQGYDLKNVWHVGNSIRSDVIPAVNAGVGIIYVPLETWTHEKQHSGKPEYERLHEVDKLTDIITLYERL